MTNNVQRGYCPPSNPNTISSPSWGQSSRPQYSFNPFGYGLAAAGAVSQWALGSVISHFKPKPIAVAWKPQPQPQPSYGAWPAPSKPVVWKPQPAAVICPPPAPIKPVVEKPLITTISQNNGWIKGSNKDDKVTVHGNGNKIDLLAGNDTVHLTNKADNNIISAHDGKDKLILDGRPQDYSVKKTDRWEYTVTNNKTGNTNVVSGFNKFCFSDSNKEFNKKQFEKLDGKNKPPKPDEGNKPPKPDEGNKPPKPDEGNKPPKGEGNKPPKGEGNKPPKGEGNKPPQNAGNQPPTGDYKAYADDIRGGVSNLRRDAEARERLLNFLSF